MRPFQPYSHRTAIALSLVISIVLNFIFLLGLLYARSNFPPPGDMRQLTDEIRHTGFPYIAVVTTFVSNFILAYLLYCVNFKILKYQGIRKCYRLFTVILGTILATLILSGILVHIRLLIEPHDFHRLGRFVMGNLVKDLFIALVVLFSSQIIYLWDKQQKTQLENQKLMTENMRSRYEALKNQVDPHFLFNSLNTLNSLIGTDDDKAREYVQQLSSVFRYTLQNKEIIRLEDELEFSRSYLRLMQIRYGDNLKITANISEKYRVFYIMPLSLQILYENAIKHNVISNKYPLTINIETTENNTIKVTNIIQEKKDANKGEGIGLANLTERYKLLLQEDVIITNANGIFSVEIPLIEKVDKK